LDKIDEAIADDRVDDPLPLRFRLGKTLKIPIGPDSFVGRIPKRL